MMMTILLLEILLFYFESTVVCGPSSILELNEKFLDVMNDGIWFVEFYAPWCGHCKRLSAIWEQVGHSLADSNSDIRVAKVDATRFTSVASHLHIQAFPTIILFRNGIHIVYKGDRSKDALVEFALKTSGPEVTYIEPNRLSFKEVKKRYSKKVFFLLVTTAEDKESKLKVDFYSSAKKLFSSVYFFHMDVLHLPSSVKISQVPTVFVFKDDTYYDFTTDAGGEKLEDWLNGERWHLFPLVTHGLLYEIGMCCNKLLALVVLDSFNRKKLETSVGKFFTLTQKVASDHRSELRRKIQFGWLDGNDIANNIIMGNVSIPGLLVFNASSHEYYLNDDTVSEMTAQSLLQWFRSIIEGIILSKGGRSLSQRLKRMAYELFTAIYSMFANQPLLTCCLFGLPLGFLAIICYSICSTDFSVAHDQVYPETDDDDTDSDHEKIE